METTIKVNSTFFDLIFILEEMQRNDALPFDVEAAFEALQYAIVDE